MRPKGEPKPALIALVLALVGLVGPVLLGLPAVILSHWAARGSKRDVALLLGWLEVAVAVVVVTAFLAR